MAAIRIARCFLTSPDRPGLDQYPTAIQKLEYALRIADWAASHHPIGSFRQQAGAGQLRFLLMADD